MQNLKYIALLFVLMIFTACTEVVHVPLSTAPPRLVVDASINWIKGTTGQDQKIKLTTTGDYYGNTVPAVSGATVYITASDNTVFNFTESGTAGEYICNNFVPVLNQTYVLTVVYKGETYTATESMKPVPPIDKVEQNNDAGFSGDAIEFKVYFTDNGATKDFYFFHFKPDYAKIPTYGVVDDQFFQGQQIPGVYIDEELHSGDRISYTLNGISERYFNYMNIILSLAGGGGGGPFQTPPATARGNVVNTTNESNYALGYFSVSESNSGEYIVQ